MYKKRLLKKTDLINSLSEATGLAPAVLETVLAEYHSLIREAILTGKSVSLKGVGRLEATPNTRGKQNLGVTALPEFRQALEEYLPVQSDEPKTKADEDLGEWDNVIQKFRPGT